MGSFGSLLARDLSAAHAPAAVAKIAIELAAADFSTTKRKKSTAIPRPFSHQLRQKSQFAHNPRCYVKGGISALKDQGFDGSWLQWFLKETETFQAKARRFTRYLPINTPMMAHTYSTETLVHPDETPFTAELPEPILPSLNYPKILHPNTINVNPSIMFSYVHNFVPRITHVAAANRARGITGEGEFDDDGSYGSAATIDVEILQAISKRVHYDFIPHILKQNHKALEALITKPEVERALLARLRKKAALYARELDMRGDPLETEVQTNGQLDSADKAQKAAGKGVFHVNVDTVEQLYENYIIPLTQEVEVIPDVTFLIT
ncbi:hypothetical protein M408DRAFT_28885 [Serendipita vermifera MAFF 305830]|uniref:chorismate mutase n=1 Tax=Serendipita vermifera MAFF 305830 TaxID=933852 RepID=A0A0C3ASK1_SERVB|nr:hypothetical protein M408DRAFT_28885 [Serendipita vermifera MAFF 305830]